jgi:Plasmid replication region DNA-binding N-term
MTRSPARVEPRARTITLARIAQMDAAITALQAQGVPITAAAVYRMVQGHRGTVQAYVKAWRQQQRQAAVDAPACSVAVAPAVTLPPPAPSVSRLEALRQEIATLEETGRRLEHEMQQHQAVLAQKRADYRNGVLEAQRLAPLFRRAYQQSLLPLYEGAQGLQREVERLRQALVRLVGEAAVERLETDPASSPWWMKP